MKQALEILLVAAMLFSVATCFGCDNGADPATSGKENAEIIEQPKYVIHLAELGEAVEIHTEDQAAYLNDLYRNITNYIPTITNTERSYPKDIELSWSINENETFPAVEYRVSLGTLPSLKGAKIYTTTDTKCPITNLCIGTTYYWNVSFEEDGIVYQSATASFTTTEQGPRNLKAEGVTNFRDIGGWTTTAGPKVKQGMIYRTARVDFITDEGKQIMLEDLGIKTELDLRPGQSTTTLDGVKYINCGCSDSATLIDLKAVLPAIFKVLADENNYPIFYHCNIGTDRTGGLTFLINALLGVAEDDLYYDYCFSNFGKLCGDNDTRFTPRTQEYLDGRITMYLTRVSGKTLQAKVRNYLKSIGISDETLNAVVRILLE